MAPLKPPSSWYLFEHSAGFHAWFRSGLRLWPLRTAQLELLPRTSPALLLRGWFFTTTAVPCNTVGDLVFVRDVPVGHIPQVAVVLAEQALGLWRHEFTTALEELAYRWTGPGMIDSLEALKKLLGGGSADGGTGACVARFDAQGGWRWSGENKPAFSRALTTSHYFEY